MLFTPSDTLVLDTARLRVWQQDDDYAYSRELVPAQKSLMDWLGEQFDQSIIINKVYTVFFTKFLFS